MSATLEITCPKCRKEFKVPAALTGKTIKCKACTTPFKVSPPAPAAPPADADAPIKFKDDPEPAKRPSVSADEDLDPYGVQQDDSHIARCPFCAQALDPPDTKICQECGYDMQQRKRHATVVTAEATGEEVFQHLLPGILCVVLIVALLVVNVICFLNMRDWMTNGMLDAGEKDEATGNAKFILPPLCFNLWIGLMSLAVSFFAGKFAVKRLILNPKPEEKILKK